MFARQGVYYPLPSAAPVGLTERAYTTSWQMCTANREVNSPPVSLCLRKSISGSPEFYWHGSPRTGVPRSSKTPLPEDLTVALCPGTYGDPREVGVSHERGTPVARLGLRACKKLT